MRFQPADNLSLGMFCALTVLMAVIMFRVARERKASKALVIGFLGMVILISAFAAFGIFAAYPFPLLPVVFVFAVAASIVVGLSEFGGRLVAGYSLAALVLFQSFRLPLEFILHHWANTGVIPETMTWTGQNLDVVTGVLALIAGPAAKSSKIAAWIFNVIGFALLLNVARVVVMSLPLPISWSLENPLQLPFHFPYVLILPFFVWPALLGHIVLTRKLLTAR